MIASQERLDAGPGMRPGDPFALDREDDYRAWRERKLAALAATSDLPPVPVRSLRAPGHAEHAAIVGRCEAANMAVYQCAAQATAADLLAFGRRLGLARLDSNPLAPLEGVAVISAGGAGGDREFIPYTRHALNWHTDGYYNESARQVRGVIMHCVHPAARGGATALLDPELAYIRLRDEDPEHIRALMAPDALTIPPFLQDALELRPARVGPVFSVDAATGRLHMRYTIRKRHVQWKDDAATRAARARLAGVLEGRDGHVVRLRLGPGQGVVCNNVLHCREAFEDAPSAPRMLLRARYLDRVGGT